jgi:hypothetical protein
VAPGVSTLQLLAPAPEGSEATFRDGTVGRNTFRGFPLHNLDLAMSKRIAIEETQIELRAEAFNLFNAPHFGIPERWLESRAFGQATTTIAPGRVLQLALRFSF